MYFTRSPEPPASPSIAATNGSSVHSDFSTPSTPSPVQSPSSSSADEHPAFNSKRVNGALTPLVLDSSSVSLVSGNGNGFSSSSGVSALAPANGGSSSGVNGSTGSTSTLNNYEHHGLPERNLLSEAIIRRASLRHFPGGSLNFEKFETDNIEECVTFIQALIERSATLNGVPIEEMRNGVKIMATGGGAHRFFELFSDQLHVEVQREDEMECLIEGLKFIALIPHEVYYFSDELVQQVSRPTHKSGDSSGSHAGPSSLPDPNLSVNLPESLERPSPNPPQFGVTFEANPTPQLPCLLVNIGSGVSIIKVDEDGSFERISGTSLGGGTLWGLLSLLTPAESFDGEFVDHVLEL